MLGNKAASTWQHFWQQTWQQGWQPLWQYLAAAGSSWQHTWQQAAKLTAKCSQVTPNLLLGAARNDASLSARCCKDCFQMLHLAGSLQHLEAILGAFCST
jgi:hypothetical protein